MSEIWPIVALILSVAAFVVWRRFWPVVVPDEFEFELGVVCAAANEGSYVREWVTWHRNQGFDHFFFYDNDTWENDYTELFGESLLPYITVQRWVDRRARRFKFLSSQRQAYNHAMNHYASRCRHLLVCDVDEFLMPAPGSPHERVIDAIRDLPKNVAWLEIDSWNFGHRPHQTRPEGGVVENYVWRREKLMPRNAQKSLVSGAIASHLNWWGGVHRPRWKVWKWLVRSGGWVRQVDNERLLRVNHYYTKSAEEWEERGRFWNRSGFNNRNGRRSDWREPPPLMYSEVEDDHARTLKEKVIATAGENGERVRSESTRS